MKPKTTKEVFFNIFLKINVHKSFDHSFDAIYKIILCYALTGQCITNRDMTNLISYFLGRKLGSSYLRQDDSEAAHGACGLWPCAKEECDCKHFEEPREDPRLREKWRDGVRVLEEKTTYIKWTDDGTKSWENFVDFLITHNFHFFWKRLYTTPWCFLMGKFDTCAVYSNQCSIRIFRFYAKPKLIFIKCLPVLSFEWLCTSYSCNGILRIT